MRFPRRSLAAAAVAVAVAATLISGPARAGVTQGNANGYNVYADLSLRLSTSTVTATVGPMNKTELAAPPAVGKSGVITSAPLTKYGNFTGAGGVTGDLLSLQTGLLESSVTSDVDGSSTTATTAGGATTKGLTLGILDYALAGGGSTTLISLAADEISTMAQVSGGFGTLGYAGGANLSNATLNVAGNIVNLDANPVANTVLGFNFRVGSVVVLLNQQNVRGDGKTSRDIGTNAIHIRIRGVEVAGVGTLDGEVIISHALASQTAIPEPSSLALLSLGGLGTLLAVRHSRRGRAA